MTARDTGRAKRQSRRRSSGATRWRGLSELALVALTHPLEPLPGQKSWTEIPFGTRDATSRNDLPWDPSRKVEIPGAGVFIQGHIDRLDLSGDGSRARVIDYKTGQLKAKMAEVVIDGGGELQRCLYAFAVKTLLGQDVEVDAALLYPAGDGGRSEAVSAARRRSDTRAVGLTRSISRDATSRRASHCPGSTPATITTISRSRSRAMPLGYLPRKMALAKERLGDAANIWEAK